MQTKSSHFFLITKATTEKLIKNFNFIQKQRKKIRQILLFYFHILINMAIRSQTLFSSDLIQYTTPAVYLINFHLIYSQNYKNVSEFNSRNFIGKIF